MKRDRNWVEITTFGMSQRVEFDANKIDGEPESGFIRHTPIGDRSGALWMPGWPVSGPRELRRHAAPSASVTALTSAPSI